MINKILKIMLLLLMYNINMYSNDKKNMNYEVQKMISEIKNFKKEQKPNLNEIINTKELNKVNSKIPKFVVKKKKKLHMYVRESYTIIEDDLIVKHPEGWKSVLIKEENLWDY